MPALATPILWVLGAGLVAGAAIKRSTEEESESEGREKRHAAGFGPFGGFNQDYEENIAPNCRVYPAFGVANAQDCSMMKQGENLNFNPILGLEWNFGGCDHGWTNFGQYCYLLSADTATREQADANCRGTGATLSSIQSQSEQIFVLSLIPQGTSVYIGGSKNLNMQWRWPDFSSVTNGFTAWADNTFPNPGHEFMKIDADGWKTVPGPTTTSTTDSLNYLCKKHQNANIPGYCRWDAHRANSDTKSACMCPTNMQTCNKRPNCFWYEDPRTPFKECISNAERFYNMLHRLLMRRGKKDFAIKIRYGATPARGQLPYGLYGPAIIGQGNPNPNSMYGVYGMRNPYDKQQGMGMFQQGGVYGPQSQLDAYGRPMPQTHMYGQYNYQTPGGMGAGHYGNRQNMFNQHFRHGQHHQQGYQQHGYQQQPQYQQQYQKHLRYQQQEQHQQQQRQEQQQQQSQHAGPYQHVQHSFRQQSFRH